MYFFIVLMESTWYPYMKVIKIFLVSDFLHRILACDVKTRMLTVNITFFVDFDGSGQKIYRNILGVNTCVMYALSSLCL